MVNSRAALKGRRQFQEQPHHHIWQHTQGFAEETRDSVCVGARASPTWPFASRVGGGGPPVEWFEKHPNGHDLRVIRCGVRHEMGKTAGSYQTTTTHSPNPERVDISIRICQSEISFQQVRTLAGLFSWRAGKINTQREDEVWAPYTLKSRRKGDEKK